MNFAPAAHSIASEGNAAISNSGAQAVTSVSPTPDTLAFSSATTRTSISLNETTQSPDNPFADLNGPAPISWAAETFNPVSLTFLAAAALSGFLLWRTGIDTKQKSDAKTSAGEISKSWAEVLEITDGGYVIAPAKSHERRYITENLPLKKIDERLALLATHFKHAGLDFGVWSGEGRVLFGTPTLTPELVLRNPEHFSIMLGKLIKLAKKSERLRNDKLLAGALANAVERAVLSDQLIGLDFHNHFSETIDFCKKMSAKFDSLGWHKEGRILAAFSALQQSQRGIFWDYVGFRQDLLNERPIVVGAPHSADRAIAFLKVLRDVSEKRLPLFTVFQDSVEVYIHHTRTTFDRLRQPHSNGFFEDGFSQQAEEARRVYADTIEQLHSILWGRAVKTATELPPERDPTLLQTSVPQNYHNRPPHRPARGQTVKKVEA